jgi:hypothetical protein
VVVAVARGQMETEQTSKMAVDVGGVVDGTAVDVDVVVAAVAWTVVVVVVDVETETGSQWNCFVAPQSWEAEWWEE